ncbi:glycine oxidase ThiO [Nocardia sp. NPDC058666]|uniref:glycine oxidase ThiO n=1 Tax=Nocardia sp. NPDC058666 TaxID=3346587 RepID=UPI0036516D3D
MRTLAVVGGGAVGLAIAWRAAEAGWTVTVYDPEPALGASYVAGGMLAPLSEGWPGEDRVLAFGAAALEQWPAFAESLQKISGESMFVADETLTAALDSADADNLYMVLGWLAAFGHQLQVLERAEVRALEPALARSVRAALYAKTEPAIDNRRVLRALYKACAGVEIRMETVVALDDLPHDRIILAAGAHSAELWPGLPVRPVKGEILRLRHRPGVRPPPTRVIRARVHGRQVYLVPREDGIVVGATQYEAGFDTTVTVGGVRDLIADAETILPGIAEYELAEASAGSRPGTPDNLPLLGHLDDRVIAATGHGRNGMLTLALTATLIPQLLDGTVSPIAELASPQRFPALSPGGVR